MKRNTEQMLFFKERYREYFESLKNDKDAVEFAFYDLKNRYGENIEMSILLEIPELRAFLYNNKVGEESYFHFGRKNSKLSQAMAGLSQKFI